MHKTKETCLLLLEFLSIYCILYLLLCIFPSVTTTLFSCMLSHQQIPLLSKWIRNKSLHSETQKILFLPNDLRFFLKHYHRKHQYLHYLSELSYSCFYSWLLFFSLVTPWIFLSSFDLLENNIVLFNDNGKFLHLQLITA